MARHRTHSVALKRQVAVGIRELGRLVPTVVDEAGIVLAGHSPPVVDSDMSLRGLAAQKGWTRPRISSQARLAYLAPDIAQAIRDGPQLPQLILADLRERDVPFDWAEQRHGIGFIWASAHLDRRQSGLPFGRHGAGASPRLHEHKRGR